MSSEAPVERTWFDKIFFSPNERRLRAGWRILIHFVGMLIGLFIFSVPAGIAQVLGYPSSIVFLLGQLAFFVALNLMTWVARRFLDKRSFVSLGFKRENAILDVVVGFGVAAIIMGAIFLAEWALGWLTIDGWAWETDTVTAIIGGLLIWAAIFALGAWQEELLARGYWLQNMAEGVNLPFGLLASSILFGLLHGDNPNVTIIALILLMVAGVFLAYGYLQTKQLWLGIGLHMGWNYFEGNIFGFQVSGLDTFRLIHQTVSGPDWITGGIFGPEAGLIVLPAMALGVGLMYLYIRYWRPKAA